MPDGRLLIGNKRYSSWSMRGWLAVHLAGLDVEEVLIPFVRDAGPVTPAIAAATPAGLVPYLEHRGARVWESLSICEYCAEQAPGLWPEDRVARAAARSLSAEMAAGLRGLRQAMWFNAGADFAGLRPHARGAEGHRPDRGRLGARRWRRMAGPSCSGRASAWPMPCTPRWSAASSPGSRCCRRRPRPTWPRSGRIRWSSAGMPEALAEPAAWQLAGYETPPAA